MKTVPELKTERLILRNITEEDTPVIVKWRSDPAVYRFFLDIAEKLSLEHQLAALYYLQMECYDNELYNTVMFKFATKPISDYLFLDAERMHWFWYNDPERVLPYFRMIVGKNRAKTILVQIMFFGLQYEKSKVVSDELFRYLIDQNEEEVIQKVIPLAYEHLMDDTYGEQSESFLKKHASDSREKVRESYLYWCDKMPDNQILLFKDLLSRWKAEPIKSGFHDIIQYLEKTCFKYPYESYQCIKLLIDNKSQISYYEEEELFKILLACYRVLMDDEETENADEVMDTVDAVMMESFSPSVSKVMQEIDNN